MKTRFLKVNIKQFDGTKIKLEDIKTFLSDNKEQDEVKAYLEELSTPTVEGVEGFLNTAEGRKLLQPRLDAYFTKGLNTWKEKNLDNLIEEEVKKRNPDKTPEQKELEQLRKEIEDERKARNRETLVNKALKVAKEKNLPDGIIDYFIADDEESTLSNLSKLEEVYNGAVQSAVESKFKENGRNVDQGSGSKHVGGIDIGQIAAEASIRK